MTYSVFFLKWVFSIYILVVLGVLHIYPCLFTVCLYTLIFSTYLACISSPCLTTQQMLLVEMDKWTNLPFLIEGHLISSIFISQFIFMICLNADPLEQCRLYQYFECLKFIGEEIKLMWRSYKRQRSSIDMDEKMYKDGA